MKFLVFSPYYPPHTGGLESHSEEFNLELIRLGNEVSVFTPALPSNVPHKETAHGIQIIRYPAFEIISNYPLPKVWDLLFWQQLFSLKNSTSPDIIITRTRFFALSFLGLLFAKIYNLPYVHIEHGSGYVKLSNPLSSALAYLYDQIFGRIILRCSNLNISISQAVQVFVQKFDTRKSPVIYRGLNFQQLDSAEIFNPSLLERYSERTILVTAARLYKWKGIESTILAIKALPKNLQDALVFVVIGDGEDRQRLETLSQGLPIIFLGRLDRNQTIGFLKKADIYIHSSYPGGGLSTSLLEAMYCECAVIATPHEGAKEVIIDKNNGLLISKETLSEAITTLLKDQATRKNLATNAKLFIQKKFSWPQSINQYLALFHKL